MTMPAEVVDAVIGIDTHRDTHEVEIADAGGKPIVAMQVSNDTAGFAWLLATMSMFDGFQLDRVDVGDVVLRVRYGGEGEPVVLLHGHPRMHTTWHRVAPQLRHALWMFGTVPGRSVR